VANLYDAVMVKIKSFPLLGKAFINRPSVQYMEKRADGIKIEASRDIASNYPVKRYIMRSKGQQSEFQALDEKENAVLRVQLQAVGEQTSISSSDSNSSLKAVIERIEPSQKIEWDSRSPERLNVNGKQVSYKEFGDLEGSNIGSMLRDYHTFFGDYIGGIAKLKLNNKISPAEVMDIKGGMRAVFCTCTGFWPVGTMICGPSCLGLVVVEFMS
jgi:hypothetical protein